MRRHNLLIIFFLQCGDITLQYYNSNIQYQPLSLTQSYSLKHEPFIYTFIHF